MFTNWVAVKNKILHRTAYKLEHQTLRPNYLFTYSMSTKGNSKLVSDFCSRYATSINQKYPSLIHVCLEGIQLQIGENIPDNVDKDSPFQIDTSNSPYELYELQETINKMNLTNYECFALIAHELGHVLAKQNGNDSGDEAEEKYADGIAKDIVGKDEIASAIDKMIDYFNSLPCFGLPLNPYKKVIDNFNNRKASL